MGGNICRFIIRTALLSLLILCSGCEDPKPPPKPSPFDEQQPIVTYDDVQKGEFTVQIGDIHKSLQPAVVVSARLRASSVKNFIETTENCDVYRVCVGKYRSKDRAESVKDALLRKNLRCGQIRVEGALKEKVGPCN